MPGTLFCGRERLACSFFCGGQLRALQQMRLRMKQHKIQQLLYYSLCFLRQLQQMFWLTHQLHSVQHNSEVVNKRQCIRSTACLTQQRKDRLPLFQQAFIQNALASRSVSAIRAEAWFIPRLLMLVAVVVIKFDKVVTSRQRATRNNDSVHEACDQSQMAACRTRSVNSPEQQ